MMPPTGVSAARAEQPQTSRCVSMPAAALSALDAWAQHVSDPAIPPEAVTHRRRCSMVLLRFTNCPVEWWNSSSVQQIHESHLRCQRLVQLCKYSAMFTSGGIHHGFTRRFLRLPVLAQGPGFAAARSAGVGLLRVLCKQLGRFHTQQPVAVTPQLPPRFPADLVPVIAAQQVRRAAAVCQQ